jgi:hypothetical protein
MGEADAFEEGHRDEEMVIDFVDFVDRANIRVVESGGGLRLVQEPRPALAVCEARTWRNFSATVRLSLRSSAL